MKVDAILASKGGGAVTIPDTASVKEAVETLGDKNIGAVLVCGRDGELSGILSERDVVRRLRHEGPAVLNANVKACMTPKPYTCEPSMSLDDVLSEMTEKRIRHLPVIDGGKLVGVISIGDVVKRKIETAEQEAAALKEYIAS